MRQTIPRRRIGAALGIVVLCGVAGVLVVAKSGERADTPESNSPPAASRASASQPRRLARSRSAGGTTEARYHTDTEPEDPAAALREERARAEADREAQTRERVKLVGAKVFEVMDDMIRQKAREQVVGSPPTAGSLAAARLWINRDFYVLLWTRVGEELGLRNEDLESGWRSRTKVETRTASYGTGSFIVVKRHQTPSPSTAVDADAEERWWAANGAEEKAAWLTALFVETSGYFEVLKINTEPCRACGGTESVTSDSEPAPQRCAACNGAVVVKSVVYR